MTPVNILISYRLPRKNSSSFKSQIDSDLVQIDLGKIRSLEKHQILAEKADFSNLPQDAQVVDGDTAKNTEYDLVLVGRRLTKEEGEQLGGADGEGQIKHFVNNQMFHEADFTNMNKGK